MKYLLPECENSDYLIGTSVIKRLLSKKKEEGKARRIGDKNSIDQTLKELKFYHRTDCLSRYKCIKWPERKFRENESRDKKLEVSEQRWTSCSQFLRASSVGFLREYSISGEKIPLWTGCKVSKIFWSIADPSRNRMTR